MQLILLVCLPTTGNLRLSRMLNSCRLPLLVPTAKLLLLREVPLVSAGHQAMDVSSWAWRDMGMACTVLCFMPECYQLKGILTDASWSKLSFQGLWATNRSLSEVCGLRKNISAVHQAMVGHVHNAIQAPMAA